ncbi:MAG: hypothetical protein PWP07_2646 [Epulopiscium sp.]|jgi:hypothetical protein|nr:hypothetical protein [Candidatus Epulonipiscium sp.]
MKNEWFLVKEIRMVDVNRKAPDEILGFLNFHFTCDVGVIKQRMSGLRLKGERMELGMSVLRFDIDFGGKTKERKNR